MKFLLGVLLIAAYTIGSRYYFVCELRGNCAEVEAETARANDLQVSEELSGYEQFAFGPNAVAADLSDNNQLLLDDIATYLKRHTTEAVELTARYRPSEARQPAGIFENIGIARAARLEELLTRRGISPERIVPVAELASGSALREPVRFRFFRPDSSTVEQPTYAFTDMTSEAINFVADGSSFTPTMATIIYLDSVRYFLADRPEYGVLITGYGPADAQALAAERADEAKRYLENVGIENPIVAAAAPSRAGRAFVRFRLRPQQEEQD